MGNQVGLGLGKSPYLHILQSVHKREEEEVYLLIAYGHKLQSSIVCLLFSFYSRYYNAALQKLWK